jgi:hypothetical protein
MNKVFFILSFSLSSFFNHVAYSQETKPQISKKFDVAAFQGVSLSSSFDVSIEYGEQQEVTITGSEEFFKKLKVDVDQGVLFLGMKKGKYENLDIKATIVIPTLKLGEVTGSGDMLISNFSNLTHLDLRISGSGDIATKELYIKDNLNLVISGSGNIQVNGSAQHSNINLTGSGMCKSSNFKTNSNLTRISGTGNAEINALKEIKVQLSGSGNLHYNGTPAIEQEITGSGKVKSYS